MRNKAYAILLFAGILAILVQEVVTGESYWPMHMHDPQRTKQSAYLGPENYSLKWTFDGAGGWPVIGPDRTVYAYGAFPNSKKLFAINPDGTVKWTFDISSGYQPPTIANDGTLYVPTSGGRYLYAINSGGSLKWTFYTDKSIDCSPALSNEGTIYVGTDNDVLYAINPDGSLNWTFYFQENCSSAKYPSLASDGTIYMSNCYQFYAINPDGTLKWTYDISGGIGIVGPSGTIYFVGQDCYACGDVNQSLYAINPDGTTKWVKDLETSHYGLMGVSKDETIYIAYVRASESQLTAVGSDGNFNWSYTTAGNLMNIAISSDGTIYLVGNYPYSEPYGIISAITHGGDSLWTAECDDSSLWDVIIGDNQTIYVSSVNKIYAFGPKGEQPRSPTNLAQLKSDGLTGIPLGAVTNEPTVVFKAYLTDPDGDRVKLQTELRRLDEYEGQFLNTSTQESDFLPSDSEATVTVCALVNGNYHWQGRAVDEKGLASEWVEFGNNEISGTDFIVSPQNQPLRPVNISPADSAMDVSLEPMLRSSPPLQDVDKDSIPWEEINGLLVTRIDSQWHITTLQGDYSDPVWNNTLTDGLIDRRLFPDLPEAWANSIPSGVLGYQTTYYWRVRYRDFRGVWSPWSEETSFTTREFRAPVADFSYDPEPAKVRQWVTLDASYSRGRDGEIIVYEWDLNGDGDFDGFTSSPKIYYYWDEDAEYAVTLRVTTDEGAVDPCTNTVYVEKSPWWEKIKGFFASDVVTLSKDEKDRFYRIIFELGIGKGTADLDYWTENQLLNVLRAKIDPNAGDLTYETLILDTLHDMKLVDSVAGRSFAPNPVIENYFKNMAEVNAWAETGLLITEEVFTGLIEAAGGSSIGVGVILMLPDLCQALVGLDLLDDTLYRQGLWYYFQLYPDIDFYALPIREKHKNEITRQYFETLWREYGGDHISDSGGLKEEFKNQIIRQLRRILLSAHEKYKFAPYQLYIIRSPLTVRVYDSHGRVTGLLNGEVREEIPNSAYDEESKTVLIFDSNDSYRYEAIGTNEGAYGLDIVSLKGGESTGFTAIDIPTSPNAVHQYTADWEVLSQGGAGVTLLIDAEGDALFERTVISDNKLTPCEVAIHPIGYELISQKKISETESEYLFRLVGKNTGKQDIRHITLNLAREPNGTSIIDSIVYFSTIQPGEQLLSDDTFTVRSDKSQDVLESELIWQVCKCVERLRSDFSHDWTVTLADLAEFTDQWLNSCSEPNWCQRTDLDQSNLVNFIDFATFAQNWLWEIIPADLDIDTDVEFTDYAPLANQWGAGNCAESAWCDGADLNTSGSVDLFDLAEFAEHWLEGSK